LLTASQSLRPLLSWQSAPAALSYRLDLSRTADFAQTYTVRLAAGISQWQPQFNLSPGTRYYWRLQGNNGCGDGALSATQSFTTLPDGDVQFAQGFEDF
jgi:hypothetical protein